MDTQHTAWNWHIMFIVLCWWLVSTGTPHFVKYINGPRLLYHWLPFHRLAFLRLGGRFKAPRKLPHRREGDHKVATDYPITARPIETSPTEPPVHRTSLPVELVERVADYLFELNPPIYDSTGNVQVTSSKPAWVHVRGWMQASVVLHNMGFLRWLRVITVRNPEDWIILLQHRSLVRELNCLDGTLHITNPQILSQFPHLYAATIDSHGDVWHDNNGQFTYRDIIVTLPPSLKRLEIIRAHGPDIKIIATVKRHCPELEELRLGRCTMFNCTPACDFWVSFPHDHDAYMSDAGTDAYAHSLGHELAPLKNLRTLRMGLYLVPSDTVLAHRLYHQRGRNAPNFIDWQTAIPLSELPPDPFIEILDHVDPATTNQLVSILHQQDSEPGIDFDCPQCVEATAEIGRIAETNANTILHGYVPSLINVQWMGWLTPGHLGVHSFELAPELNT